MTQCFLDDNTTYSRWCQFKVDVEALASAVSYPGTFYRYIYLQNWSTYLSWVKYTKKTRGQLSRTHGIKYLYRLLSWWVAAKIIPRRISKVWTFFFFLQGSSDEIILKISASPKKVDLNKSPSKKPPQKASEAQDHWVDKCSRLLFPAMYSIFLIAYVIHYKNKIED